MCRYRLGPPYHSTSDQVVAGSRSAETGRAATRSGSNRPGRILTRPHTPNTSAARKNYSGRIPIQNITPQMTQTPPSHVGIPPLTISTPNTITLRQKPIAAGRKKTTSIGPARRCGVIGDHPEVAPPVRGHERPWVFRAGTLPAIHRSSTPRVGGMAQRVENRNELMNAMRTLPMLNRVPATTLRSRVD